MTRVLFDESHVSERVQQTRLCLRELAQDQKVTIAELQRRTGLTRSLIERYWRNTTKTINLIALGLLAEALQKPVNDLLTWEPEDAERH